MTKITRRRRQSCRCEFAALIGTTLACSMADAATPQGGPIEEVIVTAQKREERLQDVPVAVTALSSESLERMQAQTFADYVTRVPGFNMISGRTGEGQLILRGLTTGVDQATATVATYLDESPIGSSVSHSQSSNLAPDLDPHDLARIEVLRGPQGTLYGVSSLGGLLKFVTRPPELDAFHANVAVSGSSVDGGGTGGGARAMVNVPLNDDTLGVRVSGYTRSDPGFIDDAGRGVTDLNKVDAKGARMQVLWAPSDTFSLRLSALRQDVQNDGDNIQYVDVTTFEPVFGDLQQRNASPITIENKQEIYNAQLDWSLGWADLLSSTSYSTLASDQQIDITFAFGDFIGGAIGIPGIGVTQPFTPHQRKLTQEFRLTSNGERALDWQLGAYYAHEAARYGQGLTLFDPATGEPVDIGLVLFDAVLMPEYDEYSAFANVTYHVTPRFEVLVGGRYSINHQTYTLVKDGLIVTGNSNAPETTFGTLGEDNFTFLLAPSFKFSDSVMGYARVASGYRPGAPNSVTALTAEFAPATYKSDTVVSYELGLKGALFAEVLTIDLAAFYIDWTDIQLTGQRAGIRFGANGGQARSQGAELAVVLMPTTGLRISANTSYTDARLTEDTEPGVYGLESERLPFVPELSANLSADYDWTFGASWSAYVGASYQYIGERRSDLRSEATSHPRIAIPAYDRVDLRAGVSLRSWSLDAYVKNITDERGITTLAAATLDDASPIYAAAVIQPRTFGFSLTKQF